MATYSEGTGPWGVELKVLIGKKLVNLYNKAAESTNALVCAFEQNSF